MVATRFWSGRKVLVTGGSGFLGGHLVAMLVAAQAEVTVLVRDWSPAAMLWQDRLIDRVQCVHGGLEDLPLLERAINEYEVDTVFHLAAQAIVGTANRNPLSTFEANIRGTWHLLEAGRRCPTVKRIIVASSDKAYGEQPTLPYTEETPLQGSHPYDVSKSCADLLASTYFHTYRLPVCITRCGNIYGGGDLNLNRLIPGTIQSLLKGEAPIIRSDGKYIRDYIYVKDAALAYLELGAKMEELALAGEAFNFSNELRLTVLEVVRRIMAVMGRTDLTPVILNQAQQEIPNQYLSAVKARERLGWRPYYDFDSSLAETVQWYTKHLVLGDKSPA